MMISRRPNRRASKENAPGPRKTRAIKIAVMSTDVILLRQASEGIEESKERTAVELPIAATALTIGVRKPMSRQEPATNQVAPRSQMLDFDESCANRKSSPRSISR